MIYLFISVKFITGEKNSQTEFSKFQNLTSLSSTQGNSCIRPLFGSPAHHPVWSTRLCILKHERPGKAALIPSVPRSLAISWVPLLTAFKKCASQKSIFTECCSVLGDFSAILPSLPTPWVPIWEGTVPSPALAFPRTPSFYTLPARGFSTGL